MDWNKIPIYPIFYLLKGGYRRATFYLRPAHRQLKRNSLLHAIDGLLTIKMCPGKPDFQEMPSKEALSLKRGLNGGNGGGVPMIQEHSSGFN